MNSDNYLLPHGRGTEFFYDQDFNDRDSLSLLINTAKNPDVLRVLIAGCTMTLDHIKEILSAFGDERQINVMPNITFRGKILFNLTCFRMFHRR